MLSRFLNVQYPAVLIRHCKPAGRNAGHLAPYTYAAYDSLVLPLEKGGAGVTSEEAVKIIRMERENYELVGEIVEKEGLNVDLWLGDGLDGKYSSQSRTLTTR